MTYLPTFTKLFAGENKTDLFIGLYENGNGRNLGESKSRYFIHDWNTETVLKVSIIDLPRFSGVLDRLKRHIGRWLRIPIIQEASSTSGEV